MKKGSGKGLPALLGAVLAVVLVLTGGTVGPGRTVSASGALDLPGKPPDTRPEAAVCGRKLVPLGRAVGIKLFSNGVLVVGLSELETDRGTVDPGRRCGLKTGDVITHINGQEVDTIEEVQDILKREGSRPMTLQASRNRKNMQLSVRPVKNEKGQYQLGVWLRDSMAGIGTMTFYDPSTGSFAALGHGINDVDTSVLMPMESGSIMYASVTDVKRGEAGNPGELHGSFQVERDLGTLAANTRRGIYGRLTDRSMLKGTEAMDLAAPEEVVPGPALILSNIAGETVRPYEAEILRVSTDSADDRNLTIRVTDPELLKKTGGIVQGMSGSPIIQNGKLVGAVTHVLVNQPDKGYGIFIENMLEAAE